MGSQHFTAVLAVGCQNLLVPILEDWSADQDFPDRSGLSPVPTVTSQLPPLGCQ